MNFFKLYIGDYQRDTAHLSVTEHGAFLLMLQHYYATEKPLPTGKALHRMLRAQDKSEKDAIDAVAIQFWSETSEGLVNARADEEITKAATQADTNSRIAREREAKRRASRTEHEACSNRSTNDQPNQTPDTRHQTKPPNPLPGFEEFWRAYPNRKARANAEKAWAKLKPTDTLKTEILQALARQCESPDWQKDAGKFIPHGATYLNGRRWEDEAPLAPTLQLVGAV